MTGLCTRTQGPHLRPHVHWLIGTPCTWTRTDERRHQPQTHLHRTLNMPALTQAPSWPLKRFSRSVSATPEERCAACLSDRLYNRVSPSQGPLEVLFHLGSPLIINAGGQSQRQDSVLPESKDPERDQLTVTYSRAPYVNNLLTSTVSEAPKARM